MFDIAVTIRDNQEWLELYLNSYKKYTKNPYDYTINIVDTSTIENKNIVKAILNKFSDLDINYFDGDRDTHYHNTWSYAVNKSKKNFVLLTHIDIVYLMKNWDIYLGDCLKNNQTLISVGHGKPIGDSSKYENQQKELCPESCWVCTYTDLLLESGFNHAAINNIPMEHGKIKLLHDQRKEQQLYITDNIQGRPKYGDIFLINNKEFVYHNYYSGRIKKDNWCPVPIGIESEYISSRENFTTTINRINDFLCINKDISLYEYLSTEYI